ncbi:YdbL family protein [Hyphomonas sp. L-53-1-40]|uniref:YdbL family protein n=1 Tax=Hyphomonas sp. L-53-1-40 TaxID=1207058 RepID=UPI0005579747|nr:YdbL family protein [Hyphomonas sp. L-53-1-40]
MMKSLRTFFAALALAFGLAVMSPAAFAGDPAIDAAIEAGEVGERIDGRLGVIGSADPSLIRKVQEINNKRAAKYAEVAAETGTTVAEVARITGEKQISKLRPGQWYMDASGSWKQK